MKKVTFSENSLIKIKESMVGSSNTASHNTVCVNEARPEVDEFELGQESDNPPLGGNYCHVNEANIPNEFIRNAIELRPSKLYNWVVIDLVDIGRIPRYFQKRSAAYDYYKWLKNGNDYERMKGEKEPYKPIIINLDKETNSINENKYDDLFNKTINDLENFRRQGYKKYGEKNWYVFSWMAREHPEIKIDPKDIDIHKALVKKCEEITKLWNDEEKKEQEDIPKDNTEYHDVISLAIGEYGLTNSLKEAGYILPDGSLLNLGHSGTRDTDHRAIEGIYLQNNIPIWDDEYKYNYVVDFMNHGAIRCCVNGGILDMTSEPTDEQYSVIKMFVRNAVDVDIDFTVKYLYNKKRNSDFRFFLLIFE